MVKKGSVVCLRTKTASYETCVVSDVNAKTISVQYKIFSKDSGKSKPKLVTKTDTIFRKDVVSISERTR